MVFSQIQKHETESGLIRDDVLSRDYPGLYVSAAAVCCFILRVVSHIKVKGRLTLIQQSENSAGICDWNFLRSVFDTAKVHESSA